ncbi:hypothetical protein L9G15_01315 [Shewanella sp. A3A]|nr:hypothetical protein [Shewanella ferrihydritica]
MSQQENVDKQLDGLLKQAQQKIDEAIGLLLKQDPTDFAKIGAIGQAGGLLRKVNSSVIEASPALKSKLRAEEHIDAQPVSDTQQKLLAQITQEQIDIVDKILLSNVRQHYMKVAMLIAKTYNKLPDELRELPTAFLAKRVMALVECELLQAQGDLHYIRYSEVRLSELIK